MPDLLPKPLNVHSCPEHGAMRATSNNVCAVGIRLTMFIPDMLVCSVRGTFMKDEEWDKHLQIAHRKLILSKLLMLWAAHALSNINLSSSNSKISEPRTPIKRPF